MSRFHPLGGVICAALMPRDAEGRPAWEEFETLLAFLRQHGVAGVCVNGATGEYSRASQEERRTAAAIARRVMGSGGLVLSGEGAGSLTETVRLAQEAEEAGADAHLVPPPHFFPYEQDDVDEFYRRVAAAVERPVLIYNLPSFTTGVRGDVALELIQSEERIAGIKDSSGRLDILEALTAGPAPRAARFVGNDSVLAEALERELCDGVISGVACVLPELTVALWEAGRGGDAAVFQSARALVAEFIEVLDAWPVPWGLQVIAGARGLCRASSSIPFSERRRRQAAAVRAWFEPWWQAAHTALAPAPRVNR